MARTTQGLRRRRVAAMAGFMREARTYPQGAVATPHYLATQRRPRDARRGRQRDRRRARREPRARRRHAVPVRLRRRRARDGLGRIAARLRRRGRAPRAATIDGVRERSDERLSPLGDMPTFGPHAVTVPGAPRGWFDLLERWGSRSFGELAATGAALRRGRVPADAARRRVLHPGAGRATTTSGSPTSATRTRTPNRATGSASPRWRRTIRALADDGPDAYYKGADRRRDRRHGSQTHGSFMTADDLAAHEGAWVEPLRARRSRGSRGRRAAAADAGRDRARSAAHRRRLRSPAPTAPNAQHLLDRGDEVRARRPQPLRRRSRHDAGRPRARSSPTTGSRAGAPRSIRRARPSRRPIPAPTAAPSTCARPTATGCSSA